MRGCGWIGMVAAAGVAAACGPAAGQTINEDEKLLASDGANRDNFGFSVALSGTTAVVGARSDDDNGSSSGSAYLFDMTTGRQTDKLLPGDGATGDLFGFSVAIGGGTVAVGAYFDDDNGAQSGSAYLFDAATGQQVDKLLPSDGAMFDEFGFSVAISGTTAVVGAPVDADNGTDSGSAYLFDVTTGQQIVKLVPDDGAAFDKFGRSVAIGGAAAVVGAPFDDDNGADSGTAYLFDTATGQQIAKLLPSDGAAGDWFGWSVAIGGTMAVVGAPTDDANGIDSGSAYLFDATTGEQIAKLLPNDGAQETAFGNSVAISGSVIVVGATEDDDNGTNSGSAYLFDATTGQQIAKLLPSDGATRDQFGWSVAISGTTVVSGAWLDDDNGDASGAVYVFTTPCPADTNGDGVVSPADYNGWILAFNSQSPACDQNGDGLCTPADYNAWILNYNAGC